MQKVGEFYGPADDVEKIREMRLGANWFLWVSLLAAADSIYTFLSGWPSTFFGLGITRYIDNHYLTGSQADQYAGFGLNLAAAGILALFGYFSRRGNDFAFILGMFLYFTDMVVSLGYRDFWGACFHVLAMFFMFKGLLASRRRYDPSVE
jgi:hypothetical protein